MKNVFLACACLGLLCGTAWGQTDLAGVDTEVTTMAGPYTNSGADAWLTFTGTGSVGTVLGQEDGANSNLGFLWNLSGTSDDANNFTAVNYHTLGTKLVGAAGVKVNAVTGAFGSGVVTLDGITLMNYNYANQTIANDIQIGANGGALRVRSGRVFTFTGNISGDGNLELDYDGGTLVLSGANTYTGNTFIGSTRAPWANAGASAALQLNSATALPTDTRLVFGTVYKQTQLNLNGQSVSVAGLDLIEGQTRTSAPTITNGSGTKSVLTVTNDTDLSVSLAKTDKLELIWNNITGTENTISAESYHTGGTTLSGDAGSVVKLTANNGTGTGALTLTDVNFDLNGKNQTVTTLSGTGHIQNSSETVGALTLLNAPPAGYSLGTADGGSLNNFKVIHSQTGEKTLVRDSVSYHSGGTEIAGGFVNFGNMAVFGTGTEITLSNGTLAFSGDLLNTGVTDKTFNATQNIILNGGGGARLRGGAIVNLSGNITGTGDFWVSYDGGTLNLSGNNTYTGKTVIGSTTNCWAGTTSVANVVLQSDTALPTNTVLEMGTCYGGSILDLNGHDITISNFQNGDLNTGTFKAPQLKSTNGPVTVTMDNGATDQTRAMSVDVGANVTFRKNGTGSLALGTVSGAGTLELNGGGAKVLNNISVANLKVLENTTFTAEAGYAYSLHSGAGTNANVTNAMEIRTNMDPEMNTNSPTVWQDNTSCCFSTLVNLTENVSLSGYKLFDDAAYIDFTPVNADGTYGTKIRLLETTEWNFETFGASTDVAAGTYLLEVWGCQGTGGVGAQGNIAKNGVIQGGPNFGLGIRTGGAGTAYTDYVKLNIENGIIGGIAQLQVVAPTREISSRVDIASGKTFTLVGNEGSNFTLKGAISGEGALAAQTSGTVTLANPSTYSGGTTLEVAKVNVCRVNGFGTGTVTFQNTDTEVVFSNDNNGWLEGNILDGASNWTATPTSWTAMPTPAITYLFGNQYSSKTAVYQTTIVPTEDVTLTFGENLDDNAYLDVTNLSTGVKTNLLKDTVWNGVSTGTYTFEKGVKYFLDMRAGLGGGNNGPSKDNNTGVFGLTTAEGASSFAWRASDDDAWSRLDFSNGYLAGGKFLLVNNYDSAFDNAVVLATPDVTTTFNGENWGNTIAMNGSITGPGNLKLTNGAFALNGTGNSVGALILDNVTYSMDKDTGFVTGTGDVVISDSTLRLNLTGMEAAALTPDLAWIRTDGDATLSNVNLILEYEGIPLDNVTSVTVVDSANTDLTGWTFTFDTLNPELRYFAAASDGNLMLTFGSAASLPEPSAWLLMLLAFAGFAGWRKCRMCRK